MNKYSKAINLLKDHYIDDIPIKLSPVYGYRSRVEFGYKNNSYTMYDENGDIKFITNLRRDIEYYTGIVFQIISGKKEIARGGRYDDLLKSLGAKKNIPAVGAAINLSNI